jgi:hypothetical protein
MRYTASLKELVAFLAANADHTKNEGGRFLFADQKTADQFNGIFHQAQISERDYTSAVSQAREGDQHALKTIGN